MTGGKLHAIILLKVEILDCCPVHKSYENPVMSLMMLFEIRGDREQNETMKTIAKAEGLWVQISPKCLLCF